MMHQAIGAPQWHTVLMAPGNVNFLLMMEY
jgi:hypothetical protein